MGFLRNRQAGPSRPRAEVVGGALRPVLYLLFALFALEAANAFYLVAVRVAGHATGLSYENRLSLLIFLLHLLLGLVVVIPFMLFALRHFLCAHSHPNRRAVAVGYGVLAACAMLLVSGVVLIRVEGIFVVNEPVLRSVAYWCHVLAPCIAVWLFVLHRLAGPPIRWRFGLVWALTACVVTAAVMVVQVRDPRSWNLIGNPEGEKYFFPSLARTTSGNFIPAAVLDNDQYCNQCHDDIHQTWASSVHRFSSFNNPPYLFSVRQTRAMGLERDGDVRASRFCAGCHDPVPFFSGRFSDPDYDDVGDPTADAGITCTVCHAISNINSPRGNADYTIDAPVHYPFAFSSHPSLRWVNRQLILAKPEFHKKTFLKPLHRSPEFCGSCHKVHLPKELNHYKWLRGQNHYDSFLLSGVSGHGVGSFYYPDRAEENCNGCHMPLLPSEDFAARDFDRTGTRSVHDHRFPSANTALPVLADMPQPEQTIAAHQGFLQDIVRVDLFGIRSEGRIDAPLTAPLRPEMPVLESGRSYLLETVIRTLAVGHHLTEGTADSNQLWLEVEIRAGARVIGRSGAMDDEGRVDPWAHFVNAYVLDREGRRIDRRNAEDIFVALYNNQIPPGAADVVHYRFEIPRDAHGPLEIAVALKYRKFDTTYMRHVYGDDFTNTLPVTVLARDRITLALDGDQQGAINDLRPIPPWERWNDYGIGLLRTGGRGELRQAEQAFQRVEALGRSEGALNLARVYLREGRIAGEAQQALARALVLDPQVPQWSILWFSGQINRQRGAFDEAIADFDQILEGGFEQAAGRNFDFSVDYRLLNEFAETLYQQSLRIRGDQRWSQREEFLRAAQKRYQQVLEIDPENRRAHWGLKQVLSDLGDRQGAARHAELHERYRIDDNARDRAMMMARRRDPAADHAAEAVVIYDLERGLDGQ